MCFSRTAGLWAVGALLLATHACCRPGVAAQQQAFRLLQAEFDGQKIGSRTYSADGYLTLAHPEAKTYQAVMVLPINSTTPEVLAEHTQQRPSLSGVLVLLPADYGQQPLSLEDAASLQALEQQLLRKATVVPVFFAAETPELAAAIADARDAISKGNPPHQHSDRWHVSIQGGLASKVVAKPAVNYVATLRATDDQFKPGVPMAPTLLITAHYDSFAAAPAAPAGADSAGSGAAAALLLLRLLHRMYSTPESRPSRNVLVVLTAGGPYGHEGLRHWLADTDPAQVEAIEAAIVLDSIGGSGVLRQQEAAALRDDGGSGSGSGSGDAGSVRPQALHVHTAGADSGRGSGTSSWLAAVQHAAQQAGVPITHLDAALPADRSPHGSAADAAAAAAAGEAAAVGTAAFSHEHLARRGVPALTLSGVAAPRPPLLAGRVRPASLADVAAGVSPDAMLAAAQVAGGAVGRWLYPDLDPELRLLDLGAHTAGAAAHRDFLVAWTAALSQPGVMLPLDQADAAGLLLHDSLRAFLKAHSHSLKRHAWPTAGSPAALEAWGGTMATIKVVKVAGFMLDMLFTAAVVVYLVALFCGLVVATRGYKDLIALLTPKPTKKAYKSNTKRS